MTAALAAALLTAGCGSSVAARQSQLARTTPSVPLDATVGTANATWATVVMGGSAAQHNDFWQLLERSPGATRWTLVTPPGTADNGGLVLGIGPGRSAVTAFRPSQYLTYTPLTRTGDGGHDWSAMGPLDAALASTPGSLALQPSTGRILALTSDGTVEQGTLGGRGWRTLIRAAALAAMPTARSCGLTSLTTAAYSPSGTPLLAGSCSRPGVIALFAGEGTTWHAVGPATPGSLRGRHITVLRMAVAGTDVIALLQAGDGSAASVLAAWSTDGTQWKLSQPFPLRGAMLASASFGTTTAAAVTTTAGTGAFIDITTGSWHTLPRVPAGTATLAGLPGGEVDALAVHGSSLTVWQLAHGGTAWSQAQVIDVPIQYGSSD